jgi:large subunit ribosomal protein L21
MFAVIQTGGKQYKVAANDVIKVETLPGDKGTKVTLDEVLMISAEGKTTIGAPTVKGASVTAEIVAQDRADKVIIFKKRRRQNSRRKRGHRQDVTVLKITGIKTA